jgi:hypothetical protein
MNPYREPSRAPETCKCRGTGKVREWDGMGGWDEDPCPDCSTDAGRDEEVRLVETMLVGRVLASWSAPRHSHERDVQVQFEDGTTRNVRLSQLRRARTISSGTSPLDEESE